MLFSILLFLCAFALLKNGYAQVDNHFISPPPPGNTENWSDNVVYHVGELVNVQWKASNLTNFGMEIIQDHYNNNSAARSASLVGSLPTSDIYTWQVTLQYAAVLFDLTPNSLRAGNVFYLQIFNNTNKTPSSSFKTRAFNITNAAAVSTTSSPTTVASTSPPAASTPSSTGLDVGQLAGIGVGVGLVGILAITAIMLYFLHFRRQPAVALVSLEETKKQRHPRVNGNKYGGTNVVTEMAGESEAEILDGTRRFEIYQNRIRRYELPENASKTQ